VHRTARQRKRGEHEQAGLEIRIISAYFPIFGWNAPAARSLTAMVKHSETSFLFR